MMLKEILAAASVVAVLVGVPLLVAFQNDRVQASVAGDAKIFTLSGVAADGVWTLETVDGTNYWRRVFARAILHVEEGDEVVLRLQSADVHHRFYAPGLGIEPVDIEPGHTEFARFRANKAGTYRYYCTAICGYCHFYMSGWIVVSPKGQPQAVDDKALAVEACAHDLPEPPWEDMVQWGGYLYQKHACVTCHGQDGKGGVVNFNYAKKTVAAHNMLAESLGLEEKEDAEAFIELLKQGVDFDRLEKLPEISQFMLVLVKYRAAKDLIIAGKRCAKGDKTGLEPPLQMRSWREVLSDRDVDSIIAYLLSLYEWEEDEDWPEEEDE